MVEQTKPRFNSPLAPVVEQFIQIKQASGYRFHAGIGALVRLDRYLCEKALTECELPRTLVHEWVAKRPNEHPHTQQDRVSIVRQLAQFMCRLGHQAYVPDRSLLSKASSNFCPRIFTHAEIRQLLRAVDQLPPTSQAPLRHLVMPEIFRLLYGCGFRLSEVLHLRVADVDLDRGVVTVRDAKFGKDRLVPPDVALVQRLQRFAVLFGDRAANAYFFPTLHGGPWGGTTVYALFRELLHQCGIPHGGRGKGPRVHDMRHTMAVHSLLRWYREGADLDAKLPILATYLGHQSVVGTQRYLHLTAELFPQIVVRTNAAFSDVIPRRMAS